ncbi:MAG TPA: LPXTG cell wall anchor domain-containing protein [Acidimicrobiales bacterium]|nr:LPXTG cell wall anchor domain-containing protein [Acidimicrobiales bacterium]
MKTQTMAKRVLAVTGGGALLLGLAGPAGAQPADPGGNNGTVKIDGEEFDSHPDNQPHVGCIFQVDFYGFDKGDDLNATVTFELVPPTAGPTVGPDTVFIGEDEAGGGTDLDAERTYDLTSAVAGVEPHPQQGFHVRLEVHADGSQGDDSKFKEFWVEDCVTPTTPSSSPTTAPPTDTTAPTGSVPGGPTTSVAAGAVAAGGALPRTGTNTLPLAAAGLALVALGTGGVVGARRLRTERG